MPGDATAVYMEDITENILFGIVRDIAGSALRDVRQGFPGLGDGLLRELAEAKTMAWLRHIYPMMIKSSEEEKLERLLLPDCEKYICNMKPSEWLLMQVINEAIGMAD